MAILITDHAFVRYLERALGLPVEQLKRQMLNKETLQQMAALGDGEYPIGEGLRAVVRAQRVVTIIIPGQFYE